MTKAEKRVIEVARRVVRWRWRLVRAKNAAQYQRADAERSMANGSLVDAVDLLNAERAKAKRPKTRKGRRP